MRQLPQPASLNERALAQHYVERFTGLASATLTLAYSVAQTQDGVNLLWVSKNGAILFEGSDYTVRGTVITLTVASVGGDKWVVQYQYRT